MIGGRAEWIHLRSTELSAQINPLGAQLSVLQDRDGRDLLWNGDPDIWAGRAPILFPIVGALAEGAYRLESNTYRLARHGFARGSAFETSHADDARATLKLRSSDLTLPVYPFDFELDVQFALEGSTLTINAIVGNLGHVPMPASLGYHPAFRWPLPYGQTRALHFIEFASVESSPVRRLDSSGLLTPEHHPTPVVQRRLQLTDSLFQDDALIFDDLRSRSVSYGADEGPRIEVRLFDAPYLGVWTKPGANFICIEPWQGVADPQGFAADFRQKPGIFEVPPGGNRAIKMEISLSHRV